MTEIPIAALTPPVTRLHCPIGSCTWAHDDPGPSGTVVATDADLTVLLLSHARAMESVIRGHLETHDLLEWVQEVMSLRAQVPPPGPDLTTVLWRTGQPEGRTVFAVTGRGLDQYQQSIGRFDSPELASEAVAAHNAERIRRDVLAAIASGAGLRLATLPWRPRGCFVEAASGDPGIPDVGVMAGEEIAAYVAVAHNDLLIRAHLGRANQGESEVNESGIRAEGRVGT